MHRQTGEWSEVRVTGGYNQQIFGRKTLKFINIVHTPKQLPSVKSAAFENNDKNCFNYFNNGHDDPI